MAVSPVTVRMPQPNITPISEGTGQFSYAWWYFFLKLFQRTGGSSGGDFGPPSVIAPTGSPFDFVPPSNGFVIVSGGGVTRMRYGPDTSTLYDVGAFYGSHPVVAGYLLEIVYARTPNVTFFPG